jgi:AraC-like DNA-binding protein
LIRYQIKSAKKLKYFYASLSDKNLYWINILIIGLFIVLVLDSISGVIIGVTGFFEIPIINTVFLLALIWYLGYYSLTQETITHNIHEYLPPTKVEIENNLCNTKDFQELKNKLNSTMKESELYKLEKINLSILSEHLGSSVKKTSYLLNQCMNTTFYDLINEFRLEEFKSKVAKGELKEKTILALAFESGFNSKATFNRIFKQKEGVSPSHFLKNQLK